MKKLSLILIILFTVSSIAQQKTVSDTVARVATIQHKTNGNQVQFNADAPTLNQIAGAPKAFYTNYWEFGDGTYSKENTPTKTYKNSGDYQVRLWATNNYDTGKPPTSRPKK